MKMRVIVSDDATIRKAWCQQCSYLGSTAHANHIRAHVKATGHTVSVSISSHTIYRRQLTP